MSWGEGRREKKRGYPYMWRGEPLEVGRWEHIKVLYRLG